MGKGSGNGTTRGDRKRNARRERLRGLLPRDGAVIGIDLAEDKQALAVVDHDVRVLARKTVKVKAFRLGEALDWAVAGFASAGESRTCVIVSGGSTDRFLVGSAALGDAVADPGECFDDRWFAELAA